jgi:hypothetical protein
MADPKAPPEFAVGQVWVFYMESTWRVVEVVDDGAVAMLELLAYGSICHLPPNFTWHASRRTARLDRRNQVAMSMWAMRPPAPVELLP